MTQDELKELVAKEALEFIPKDGVLGVGSGSTVVKFIEAIKKYNIKVDAAVSSSIKTTNMLKDIGIRVLDTNDIDEYEYYIDGADEIDDNFHMIKGGGACLTREKICASMASKFVCIADESKLVTTLGKFPLPVEIIPMARKIVSVRLRAMGANPVLRPNCITDNNCEILDLRDFMIENPIEMEKAINDIPGVVTVGLFAKRKADILLYATKDGVKRKSI